MARNKKAKNRRDGLDRRTPRSARQAMAAAKRNKEQRRVSDIQVTPQMQRAIRNALKTGKRPQFPAAMTKASINAAMKYMRERQAGGKRINYREMMSKAVAAHSKAYAGKGGPNRRFSDTDRRSGGERRA